MSSIIYPVKPDFLNKTSNYVGYSVISIYQNKTHYNGHYLKYINKLNELIGTDKKLNKINELVKGFNLSPEQSKDLIIELSIKLFSHDTPVYRNASQIYNHEFYWRTMTDIDNSAKQLSQLKSKLFSSEQEYNNFYKKFIDEGTKHFGSGWEWIIINNGKIDVITTHDSEVPFESGNLKIVGVIDLWEHAYYLDYQSDRKKYLEETFKVLNWNKFIV
jgi:Fe-Mn family superoxide dismutase